MLNLDVLGKLFLLAFRKVRRGFLRLYPQSTLDLAFAGRPYPKALTRLGLYSDVTFIKSNGVLPNRPVSHAFSEREFFCLENPTLDPSMGEIYLESGEFLIQSTPWHLYVPYPERRPPIRKPKRIHSPNGYISFPAWTYYHQVIEYLAPYLFLKQRFPEATTLVPKKGSELARGILDELGFDYLVYEKPLSVNLLYFVSYGNDSGYPHPRDISILKSSLIPLAMRESPTEPYDDGVRTVYVSRLKANRSPINELDLVRELNKLSFVRVINSEELGFFDQIRLFTKVKTIVGVHGAGLANQVWSRSPGHVLELVDKAYSNPVFSLLAAVSGHTHEALIMETNHMNQPIINIEEVISRIQRLV